MPFQNGPVHRDAVAGFHQNHVPDFHLVDGDFGFFSILYDNRGLGGKSHEFLDRLGGFALGDGFERFAQQNQGDDDTRRFKIQPFHRAEIADGNLIGGVQAVGDGRGGADGDQGIHVGTALDQRLEANGVKFIPGNDNRDRQDNLRKGECQRILHRLQPLRDGEGQPPDHRAHCQIQQGQGKYGGNDEFCAQHPDFFFLAQFVLVHRVFLFDIERLIPGVFNCLPDCGQLEALRMIKDSRLFRGKVDRYPRHAFQPAYGLFDPLGACRAGHTADGDGDLAFLNLFHNAVSGLFDSLPDQRRGKCLRFISHRQFFRGEVDGSAGHPFQIFDGLFDPLGACRAGHPAYLDSFFVKQNVQPRFLYGLTLLVTVFFVPSAPVVPCRQWQISFCSFESVDSVRFSGVFSLLIALCISGIISRWDNGQSRNSR